MLSDIAENAKEFGRSLEKLASFVKEEVSNKVIRKTCFDLYMSIVQRTPV